MKYRKLRIAWSVAWGVVCLLLVALWVRSYWSMDRATANLSDTQYFCIASRCGTLGFATGPTTEEGLSLNTYYVPSEADDIRVGIYPFDGEDYKAKFGFERTSGDAALFMPHWFVALIASLLAAVPWLHWRFSLSTLLIGMTVAAIGLGWLIYVLRGNPTL